MNYMSGGKHRGGKGGYECGSYRRCSISGMEKKCTPHHIGFVPIYDAVLRHVQKTLAYSVNAENVISLLTERELPEYNDPLKDLEKLKRRMKELKLLMKTTLEQSATGVLGNSMVTELLAEYQNEYNAVAAAIKSVEEGPSKTGGRDVDVQRFIENTGGYTVIDKLTRDIVLDFIDKLVIYEPVKTGNTRTYKIDIYYRFTDKSVKTDIS